MTRENQTQAGSFLAGRTDKTRRQWRELTRWTLCTAGEPALGFIQVYWHHCHVPSTQQPPPPPSQSPLSPLSWSGLTQHTLLPSGPALPAPPRGSWLLTAGHGDLGSPAAMAAKDQGQDQGQDQEQVQGQARFVYISRFGSYRCGGVWQLGGPKAQRRCPPALAAQSREQEQLRPEAAPGQAAKACATARWQALRVRSPGRQTARARGSAGGEAAGRAGQGTEGGQGEQGRGGQDRAGVGRRAVVSWWPAAILPRARPVSLSSCWRVLRLRGPSGQPATPGGFELVFEEALVWGVCVCV